MLRQAIIELTVATRGRRLYEVTVCLWEHRRHPHTRRITAHFIGE
jgi:hypothetical protein